MANKFNWRFVYFYLDMKGDHFYFDIVTPNGRKMADIYAVQYAFDRDNYVKDSLTFVTRRKREEV